MRTTEGTTMGTKSKKVAQKDSLNRRINRAIESRFAAEQNRIARAEAQARGGVDMPAPVEAEELPAECTPWWLR